MAENPQSNATPASSGTSDPTSESGGTSNGQTAPATSGESNSPAESKSYQAKIAAAKAKVEAKQADPKGASGSESGPTSGAPSTKAAAGTGQSAAKADGTASGTPDPADEATKRVEELGRAARTAREEAKRAKEEREALAKERAEIIKEREAAKADLDLAKQLKQLKAEGKHAEAWDLFMADKSRDMEVFSQIADRVSGNDGTVTAADVAKMVESKLKDAEDAKAKADDEAKKTKEREAEQRREKAWSEYLDTESEDPNERGVIPTYVADKSKWPAIKARGASREYIMKVTREMRSKEGDPPTATDLLAEINRRLQATIDAEAKALGYVKPEAKKPPPAQNPNGGSPKPGVDEAEPRPGETKYQAKIRMAKQQLRG